MIPHFKRLIMFNLDFEAQGRGRSFTFCHDHLKKAILHHKRARVRFHLNTAVCDNFYWPPLLIEQMDCRNSDLD